jgi:PAS domain S-box-containing protein
MGFFGFSLAAVSGICFVTGLFHLFIGLRRQGTDMKHFTFGLFALAYSGAVLTALLMYRASTVPQYLTVDLWSGVFAVLAHIFLIWFVAIYTDVQPLPVLAALTILFASALAAHLTRPTLIHGEIMGMAFVVLPWGEQIAFLDAAESTWQFAYFAAQLVTIGFLFYACMRQYRRGERGAALALGAGLLFFVATIIFDMFVESGVIDFVLASDFGFLGLAIVISLQMTNNIIRTEEELDRYRGTLETLVQEQTAELHQSTRTARALLNAPSDSALLIDPQGIILDINEIGAARLGTSEAGGKGNSVYDLFEPEIAEFRRAKVAELITTGQPVRWEDVRLGRHMDNSLYPILDDQGQVASIAVFGADITERKQAEEELRGHIEAGAIREERGRIARDLHDSVTQTLYSASLIAEALPRVWERKPEQVKGNLTMLLQLMRGALAEMRTLLFELRPAALEEAGLDRLLHQLADVLTGRTQTAVEVTVQGRTDLPVEDTIAFYRIAQEAFNNIAKHASAARVTVTLQNLPDRVILSIQDDGWGFDPDSVPAERMGMRIMRERAEAVGAALTVETTPGRGTRIIVLQTTEEMLDE